MDFLTEIPDIWLGTGAGSLVVGIVGGILHSYRSTIKRIDEKLEKLDTKMEDGFKESREALTSLDTKMDTKIGKLDTKLNTKIDTGNAAIRREIQAGNAAIRQEIGGLTTVVFRLAEGVGVVRGIETARRPEEVPVPAEPIAEAG